MSDVVQTPIRCERSLVDLLRLIARWHRRSLNADLVLAAELFTHLSLLAMLKDPAARRDPELQARLEAEPHFEERVRENLLSACSRSIDASIPGDLLEVFNPAA